MNYPFLVAALLELKPNTPFIIDGENELQNVTWGEGVTNIPTDKEIIEKCNELLNAEPMKQLRIERDRLLSETDWVTAKAMETEEPIPAEWKAYRQALRDLPATAVPKLENGRLTDVTWPEKPE